LIDEFNIKTDYNVIINVSVMFYLGYQVFFFFFFENAGELCFIVLREGVVLNRFRGRNMSEALKALAHSNTHDST
jgi:hypothetical protein